jgi:hypothetical protein
MAKKKEWRVRAEFDGKVALETQKSRVVISNKLSQEKLAELAGNRLVAGYLEKAPITQQSDVTK